MPGTSSGGHRVQDGCGPAGAKPRGLGLVDGGGEETVSVLRLLLGGEGTGGPSTHGARGRDQGAVP